MPRVIKIALRILAVFLLLVVLLLGLLQLSSVQTYIAKQAGSYLSKELNAKVSIEKVEIDLCSDIHLKEFFIEDQKKDTLIYVKDLISGSFDFSLNKSFISLDDITLDRPQFNLRTYAGEDQNNLQFIVDYFSSEDTVTKDFLVQIEQLKVIDGNFKFHNYNYSDSLSEHFNSHRITLNKINGSISQFNLIGDSLGFSAENLSLLENSGLALHSLTSDIVISPTGIVLNNSQINLGESQLKGDLSLNTDSYTSYADYINDVKHSIILKNTRINLKDLNKFSQDLSFKDFPIDIDGKITGRIARLRGKNIKTNLGENSVFEGNFSMSGLPNIKETFIDLSIATLSTSKTDLEQNIIPALSGKPIKLAKNLNTLGTFNFSGDFTGFTNDFVAYGTLNTDIGILETDIEFKGINSEKQYEYRGILNTRSFDLAALYSNKNLGKLSSSITVSGAGITRDNANITVDGEVRKINFGEYNFTDIDVNGKLKDNYFSGQLISKDPKADLVFNGNVDFTNTIPLYSFTSDIKQLNVSRFLGENSPVEAISANVSIEGSGNSPDNAEGEVCLENLVINSADETVRIESLFLHSSLDPKRVTILESDIIDATLKGKYTVSDILAVSENLVREYYPIANQTEKQISPLTNFNLNGSVKNIEPLSKLLPVDLYISSNTNFMFSFGSGSSRVNLFADTVKFENYSTTGLNISYDNQNVKGLFNIESSELKIGESFIIKKPELSLVKDSLRNHSTSFSWDNGIDKTSGRVNLVYSFDSTYYSAVIDSGYINTGPLKWDLGKGGIKYDDKLVFKDLRISDNEQLIYISGGLNSENPTNILLKNIEASTANYFTPEGTVQFSGLLNSEITWNPFSETNTAYSDFTLSDFKLDDISVGDISSQGVWDNAANALNLSGQLTTNGQIPFEFNGSYSPFNTIDNLDFLLTAKDLKLNFLSAIVKDAVSEFGGKLSGEISVTGALLEPQLEGELNFNEAQVKIDYLNTSYRLKDAISIRPDMFNLDGIRLVDQEGNEGIVIGSVMHSNFREWSYDIFIDIENKPFLCLNTSEYQNELFYGKAYGLGFISISGYGDVLEINANARTAKNTSISMPVGAGEDVIFEDFVSFVTDEDETLSSGLAKLQDQFNLYLDLEIDVTDDATFKLIFDQVTGDILEGKGQGHLSLIVDEKDDFQMYGNLEVVEGNYLFTLQNLINKEFIIQKGGRISWYGDPFLADIDLSTVYKLSAPLYDILGNSEDDGQSYRNRVPVNLVMNLDGKLLNPSIAFDIELPNSDEITRNQVYSIIRSEQEKNRQAFSLLVLKKFLPTSNFQGQAHSQLGLAENSTEFLSSQLNNWLSNLTDEVDIGFNYRPGDEISNQEIELALSTQLFNDRLLISGNLNYSRGNEQNSNPTSLLGDVRIEYLLGKDGKIRLLVYNETDNFDINSSTFQTTSTQGVGLLYKEEFGSWSEFTQQFKQLLKGKS